MVIRFQYCEHMVGRFFLDGIIDTSSHIYQQIDFTPEETIQDEAKRIFMDMIKE